MTLPPALLLAAFTFLAPISCANDSEPELPRLQENTSATVLIRAADEGHGTGVAVSHCGHILTNNHVVAGANRLPLQVLVEGFTEPFEATIVATDENYDLAIIHIRHAFQHVAIIETDDDSISPGDESYSIGFPHRFGRAVSRGYVRILRFAADSPNAPPSARDAVMLRQRLEPGTSGSGIFSIRHGRLIGLMSSNLWSGNDILYLLPNELVVPLRHIRPFLETNDIIYCRPTTPLLERIRDTIRGWLQLE